MYNKVATDMNFVSREKAIAELWKKKDIVRKSYHHRDGAERFTFFDGPPTANGKPHIGHASPETVLICPSGCERETWGYSYSSARPLSLSSLSLSPSKPA